MPGITSESIMNKSASTADFIHFSHGDLEQSIPARFEQQVQRYPDKLAVKTRFQSVTRFGKYRRTTSRNSGRVVTRETCPRKSRAPGIP